MADTVQEAVAPPASLSEFRARKAEAAAAHTAPPAEKQAPSAVPQGETAGNSASPTQETQEQPKKRAKNAEERAAELRAAGRVKEAEEIEAKAREQKEFDDWKASRADRERDAEELRQLRAAKTAPPPAAAPAPPVETKPAAVASAEEPDFGPYFDDFIKDPKNAELPYHVAHARAWQKFNREKVQPFEEAQRQAKEQSKSLNEKVDAVRKEHADVDQVFTKENLERSGLHPAAIAAACQQINGGVGLLYRVMTNPTDLSRLRTMAPVEQIIELGLMARSPGTVTASTTSAVQTTPEKTPTPPPVSRTPPPVRSISGISPREDDRTGPPKSLSEHRARKTKAS